MSALLFDDVIFDSVILDTTSTAPLFDLWDFDRTIFDGYGALNAKIAWMEFEVPKAPTGGFQGSAVQVWNGSSYVTGNMKYWNGSAWVAAQAHRWNGSSWSALA